MVRQYCGIIYCCFSLVHAAALPRQLELTFHVITSGFHLCHSRRGATNVRERRRSRSAEQPWQERRWCGREA